MLNFLFPRICPVCGNEVSCADPSAKICDRCSTLIEKVKEPYCLRCGRPLADGAKAYCGICGERKRRSGSRFEEEETEGFERGLALFTYRSAGEAVMLLKYYGRKEFAGFFGDAAAERFRSSLREWKAEALVPVPSPASRKRTRGFNQAEALAECMGRRLGLPVKKLLSRQEENVPLKELNPAQRLAQLADIIRPEGNPAQFATVVLVDDIYTTGTTMEACGKVLKAAGVKKVYFIVMCIGMEENS